MKLQDQVITLEQAKKLKELGVEQKSFFSWFGGFEGSKVSPEVDLTDQRNYDVSVNGYYGHPDRTFAAYTVAELGEMLPISYTPSEKCQHQIPDKRWICGTVYGIGGEDSEYEYGIYCYGKTEAQARGSMLIHLLENHLLTPSQVNEERK